MAFALFLEACNQPVGIKGENALQLHVANQRVCYNSWTHKPYNKLI